MADERDPKVSQRYRELPGEEPSRELDQHILAAAHRATGASHAPLVAPAGRHRWYFSLAAAAVLVFAVAITLHLERQQPDPEAVSMQDAVKQEAKEPQQPAAPPPVLQEQREAPQKAKARPAAPSAAPPAFTPEPGPPAQSPAAPADAVGAASGSVANAQEAARAQEMARQDAQAEKRRESRAAPSVAARSAPVPAAGQLGSVLAERAADTPEGELERIARLRRDRRHEEADKALAEFRKRYPDYQISAQMRAKVERAVPAR